MKPFILCLCITGAIVLVSLLKHYPGECVMAVLLGVNAIGLIAVCMNRS